MELKLEVTLCTTSTINQPQHARMGSSSSKPSGRKLAQTVASQVRPGAAPEAASTAAGRSTAAGSPPSAASRGSNAAAFQASQGGEGAGPKAYGYGKHSASETKTKEILEDAGDPTLLQNLQRLGPVAVEHPNSPLDGRNGHHNRMLDILAARAKDVEHEEGTITASASAAAQQGSTGASAAAVGTLRLSPSTIASLLDERKDCTSQEDLERLAVEYDVPIQLIEVLGRYVNTPSVSESMGRRERLARFQSDDSHDGPPLVYAVWTEPKMDAPKRLSG
ncbi:hypothetical protein OC842_001724 [Tilletia horrida]|uniref:Uncharacterized protein n=1 Tax=Tilletia horrida TaxID=155126 RepID=A0AAN6GFX9_9BASI|nr:hypothetical protein OC842_001724 [Tilletia horrida]